MTFLAYIKTHPNAKPPRRATPGAACFDLSAATITERGAGGLSSTGVR